MSEENLHLNYNINDDREGEGVILPLPSVSSIVDVSFETDAGNVTTEEYENSEATSPKHASSKFIPDVGDVFKPIVGTIFYTLEEAYEAYKKYAMAAGFDVRKATQRKITQIKVTQTKVDDSIIKRKFFLCSKAGSTKRELYDSLEGNSKKKRRRRSDFRTNCLASLKVHLVEGKYYKVYQFNETHNHCFVSPNSDFLQHSKRGMSYSHTYFLMKASNNNIGPIKTYNLLKELSGSYDTIGATKIDAKNCWRDVLSFIGDKDAQMIVEKYNTKKEISPNFSFEYLVDAEGKLISCFWADEAAKLNYQAFGDVLSFDATFKKNKYNMIFVPFTGVDNHQKCVTFAIGLLSSETVESYKWLLNVFLAVHVTEPHLVVTDQDPSMKQAIEDVFKTANHRLCMWHIMNKIQVKVGPQFCDEGGFRSRLHGIVWSEVLDPMQFEEKWSSLLKEFNLEDHKWLNKVFGFRDKWIPAYFRGIPMSGLMKTTSRSESENYFFGQNSNWKSTLVHFFSRFETAMDKQRYTQRFLDHQTRTTTPRMNTPLKIEKHAAEVYTREVFFVVQEEIYASLFTCSTLTQDIICDIDEERKCDFKIAFNESDKSVSCSCLHFERYGLLCRHIFYVLRHRRIEKIPERYILTRWRRDAVKLPSKQMLNGNPDANNVLSDIYSSVGRVIHSLGNDIDKLGKFLETINSFNCKTDDHCVGESSWSKKDVIESLLGIKQPEEVTVQVPNNIRNKGCGTSKRYIGAREESINKASRQKRACKTCGKPNHNSRSCKEKNV